MVLLYTLVVLSCRKAGMVFWTSASRGSRSDMHGRSQIEWRSELMVRAYQASYREPCMIQPVRMIKTLAPRV